MMLFLFVISLIMVCGNLLTQSASPAVWFYLTVSLLCPVFTQTEFIKGLTDFFCLGFQYCSVFNAQYSKLKCKKRTFFTAGKAHTGLITLMMS